MPKEFMDGVEVSCKDYKRLSEALKFAEQIARMTHEEEIEDGMSAEDAFDTVNRLILDARKLTGLDPEHPKLYCMICGTNMDRCDCERPGPCLTCSTMCDDEGICPRCSRLEQAQEALRVADSAAQNGHGDRTAMRKAKAAITRAKNAHIGSCAKCGKTLFLGDVVDGQGCTDEGEGPEAGRVFLYCSEHCLETH